MIQLFVAFDELARYSHKGDGKFCFELFPMEKEKFEEESTPDVWISIQSIIDATLQASIWSYTNNTDQILLVCDYYEKKMKKRTIVQTADGKVMTKKKYKEMVKEWKELYPATRNSW